MWASSLSHCNHSMKTKVQHRKLQRSCWQKSLLYSPKTIEISSSSLLLSHLKFIISKFFVDEECAKNGFINSVFLMDFRWLLCSFLGLLGSGLCVWLMCKSRVIFWVDFLMGHKRSTYTWVNTGIPKLIFFFILITYLVAIV